MNPQYILEGFSVLPPEAQKEAADLIGFLKERYATNIEQAKQDIKMPLAKESFIGIWCSREDMEDSTQWVKDLRAGEWK